MSRTALLKLAYPVVLALLLAGCIALMTVGDGGWGLLAVALVLLVPGRVQGAVYRDFFRGRRLLAEGRFAESVACSERFLEKIRRRPGIRHLVWLQWTVYTPSMEAMTLNNLGAAHFNLGNADQAERYLAEALRVDPRYAMPHYNLALIAAVSGDHAEAERRLAEARRLGLTGGRVDQAIQHAGSGLACVEGRGSGA